jgi:hypothetical protein
MEINTENIHKLATHEDGTYIHKILGGICFVHFIYQFVYILNYGVANLNTPISNYMVATHGVLSISSMIFHIPATRNRMSPMIYPEFRLHSIIFALRSVVCYFLCYYEWNIVYKMLACFMTMTFADVTTYLFYDEKNDRKTTMRGMPFNDDISREIQAGITQFHSSMQIGATLYMLGNTSSTFFPLYAIQLSAFMMTLVRKNIITAMAWHRYYTCLLIMNVLCYYSLSLSYLFPQIGIYYLFKHLRFQRNMNKYVAWFFCFYLFYYLQQVCDYINIDVFLTQMATMNIKHAIITFYLVKSYKYVII